MTEYLIAFNDEWVPDHTVESYVRSPRLSGAVAEMKAAGVLIFTGGLDAATRCSAWMRPAARPCSPTSVIESKETSAASPSWTCLTRRRAAVAQDRGRLRLAAGGASLHGSRALHQTDTSLRWPDINTGPALNLEAVPATASTPGHGPRARQRWGLCR